MKYMSKLPTAFLAMPFALAPAAHAQSSSSLTLEEIIVTATKRETTLQDTAIAVTAFSADLMEELDVTSPFDYEMLVPSFTYQQEPNRLSIRGVGRFSNSLGVSPGVAIYNDGVFTAEATALATQPINIERSEILRGPQGTLYGRNTTGGAVNIITRRPTSEFEADFRVKLGDYDLKQYAAVLSGPITDNFRYKLHAVDTKRDGLQENIAGRDLRTLNSTYYEVQFEWDITEKLNLWLKWGNYDNEFISGDAPSEDPYDCVNNWEGLSQSVQYLECQEGRENVSIGDPRKVARNTPGRNKLSNNHNYSAKLAYEFDSAQLSYLYGRVGYDYDSSTDYDDTPNDYSVVLDVGQYQKQTTHEIQLTSDWDKNWHYIAGLFYFEDENEQPYNINAPGYERIQTVTRDFVTYWDNPLEVLYFQNGLLDNTSWAAYGEVEFELAEQWSLILGARYSKDDYEGAETQLRYYDLLREGLPFAYDAILDEFAGDPGRYVDTFDARYEDSFENVTGKITLSYKPTDDHMLWGTVSNGYKMGGIRLGSLEKFNSEAAGVESTGEFKEEKVISYELGWKASLLDNRLSTEVVGYFYDYEDMQQLRSYKTEPPVSITLDQVVNLDTDMYGIEFSGTYIIGENLRAIATYSYNSTEIISDSYFENYTYGERDENGDIIPETVKGNNLTLTPEQKAALSLHYFIPTRFGEFNVGGTYAYMGERFFDLGNYNHEGDYSLLDLQASWTSEKGRYKVLAAVSNVTDEEVYNTYACTAASEGVYGTDSFITRCSGNPIDQRLWSVQFMLKI